ncbi:hypothetical protein [Lysinibacillus sp. LZ02]|uniref:hypothetical protein n=1 Tax=Lysinibacillus sp. LZ02 TaxID=3420668 RepID=UPI003D3669D0
MKTKLHKQQIAKQNYPILYAVYHLGKGILWRSQLAQYMRYFCGMSDTNLSRALGELVDADILEIHRHLNRRIIRIKKYGIYFLTGLNREETPSITFKMSKALNSAYINSVLLYNLLDKEPSLLTLETFVKAIKTNTTFLSKQKQSHHILLNLLQKVPYKHNWRSINSHYEKLDTIQKQTTANLRCLELPESHEIVSEFNLNSIQARNIYIGDWHCSQNHNEISNKITLHGPVIYILDINHKYNNIKKLDNLLTEIRNYLQDILDFPPGLIIRYKLIVEDAHREAYYHNKKHFEVLLDNHYLDEIEILNLNIVNEVFAGITILK